MLRHLPRVGAVKAGVTLSKERGGGQGHVKKNNRKRGKCHRKVYDLDVMEGGEAPWGNL